ncbi:MAG TPA: VWA domain-containing protein, partial [Longimicrobiaceae bacterium]|nr:VWA domain-containing protein [Longimicrobiaceae bacterium]
ALGLAAADPRWGRAGAGEGGAGGAEVVLVMDASNSMLAEDVRPNRLERQREAARMLVRGLPGSRFGVVAFAGRGYVLSPLTGDPGALELYLDALSPGIVTQGGSSLAGAIRQGTDLLLGADSTRGGRVLVLMSDGEALEERAEVQLEVRRARRAGVTIHTLGLGTEGGAPVPDVDPVTGRRSGYKREPDGRVAVSRLVPDLLREVARGTGGSYHDASDPGAVDRLMRSIAAAPSATPRADGSGGPAAQYEWFLALALLLLAADSVLAVRARRGSPAHGRPAVMLCLALATVLGGCNPGNRLYRKGEYRKAAEAYADALREGDGPPELRYNFGTALLRLEAYDSARSHLAAATAAGEDEVRQRAAYNGGNADLVPVFLEHVPEEQRRPALERAVASYKLALLADPGDADAKWNLELALRLLERRPEESGGGGGGEDEQDGGGGDDQPGEGTEPDPSPGGPGALSRAQAERILGSAQEAERRVQGEQLRRQQPRSGVLRDW